MDNVVLKAPRLNTKQRMNKEGYVYFFPKSGIRWSTGKRHSRVGVVASPRVVAEANTEDS